jgi:ribonuclease BN (tRNA processing enzyme)
MSSLLFLGTAGGRVLVFRQLRASGGLWLESNGTNILFDPGPGALIRCLQNNLNPQDLDAIVLSHKHLDHSADANVMIEAISEGGFKPKGWILAPGDCYDEDPVILKYNRNYLDEFVRTHEGFKYQHKGVELEFPIKHEHGVETYGYKIKTSKFTLSHIVDTKFFDALIRSYNNCDILVINTIFSEPRPYPHLCVDDAIKLIEGIKPSLAILTHFGYKLWQENPEIYAEKIQNNTGIQTIAARDGLKLDLENSKVIE